MHTALHITASRSVWILILQSQFDRLQLILNFSAWAVCTFSQFNHSNSHLKSIYRFEMKLRKHNKFLFISYKTFLSGALAYLPSSHYKCSVESQIIRINIPLQRPSVRSRLKQTDRQAGLFHYASSWTLGYSHQQFYQISPHLSLGTSAAWFNDSTRPLFVSVSSQHKTFLFS